MHVRLSLYHFYARADLGRGNVVWDRAVVVEIELVLVVIRVHTHVTVVRYFDLYALGRL